jgi:hypothetical protein
MQNANLKIFFLPALGVADNYYLALAEELKKQLRANVSIISPPGPGGLGVWEVECTSIVQAQRPCSRLAIHTVEARIIKAPINVV